MVNTDDTQGYGSKYKNQKQKLRDARESGAIGEADYEAIREFIAYERANNKVNTGTLVSKLNRLRLSAERAPDGLPPLPDMTLVDVTDLMESLRDDHGLSEGTIRNYRKALRVFYRWVGVEWWESVKVGSPVSRPVESDELLTEKEIDAMLDTCESERDKAAIAVLADCGMRVGMLTSIRVKDIDLSGRVGTISANENANVKGASGSVPLTWSRGYVEKYLATHPTIGRDGSREPDPDAAFIHKTRRGRPSDDPESDNGALTYIHLWRRLRELAEHAGVNQEKVNTHNFRKTAITQWVREGLPEQAIKHRSFWVKDSSQFDVYSGVTNDEMNEDIAAHYGIKDPSDAAETDDRSGLQECPRCDNTVRGASRFCPGCGNPLTQSAVDETDYAEDLAVSHAAETTGESAKEALNLREVIKNNPELIAKAFEDAGLSPGESD